MSEQFSITFQGGEDVGTIIQDIKDGIDGLKTEDTMESEAGDEKEPEIVITSFGAENEIEEFLMDVLKEIQDQAVDSEADFTGHL